MSVGRCDATANVGEYRVRCERENAHGGAHTAHYDDPAYDPDYIYVISWWPVHADAVPAVGHGDQA